MSRGGRIGGGNRRHRRPFGLPKAPVRWFSSISPLNENPCLVNLHTLHCSFNEGPTAFELIQGTSDFDVLDKQEVTIERVVGNLDVRYSQLYNYAAPSFQIPCVRLGLLTVEGDLDVGTYVPPDLFDPADVEETSFMWLYQSYCSSTVTPVPLDTGDGFSHILLSNMHVDVDVGVRRKIGRAGHLLLIAQAKYDLPPATGAGVPLVTMVNFLRVLVKA